MSKNLDIFHKIQHLPDYQKRILVWIAVIAVGMGLLIKVFKNTRERMLEFQGNVFEQFEQPVLDIQERFKELPMLDLPSLEEFNQDQDAKQP